MNQKLTYIAIIALLLFSTSAIDTVAERLNVSYIIGAVSYMFVVWVVCIILIRRLLKDN